MAQNQDINLLDGLTVNPISAFNSKLIIQLSIGWVLILTLIYVLGTNVDTSKQKILEKLKADQEELTEKIRDYGEEAAIIEEKTKGLQNLPRSSTNILGFYRYFKDLAEYTPHGVWLEDIAILEPNDVTLRGSTITPPGVSELIKSLNKSKSFRNKKFGSLKLQKNGESGDIDFRVSTFHPNPKQQEEKEGMRTGLLKKRSNMNLKETQTDEQLKTLIK